MEIAYSEIDFNQDYTTLIPKINTNQDKFIKRDYSIYKISPKNKDLNLGCFVGQTINFKSQKNQYASNVKNLKINRPLIKHIRNNGGWNKWEMVEIEKINCNSNEARIRHQELIELYNPNLNIRNAIKIKKQPIRKHKKITLKEKLDDFFDYRTKNANNKIIRKNKSIEKKKEKRHNLFNKNRVLKQQNEIVEQNEEGYVYCFSNSSMPNICKIGCTEREPIIRLKEANISNTWKPPTQYKLEIAKKVKNMNNKESIIHKILLKERINPNREFFKTSIDDVKNLFDLMDGEYYSNIN
jgi:hypothetical protein